MYSVDLLLLAGGDGLLSLATCQSQQSGKASDDVGPRVRRPASTRFLVPPPPAKHQLNKSSIAPSAASSGVGVPSSTENSPVSSL